MKKKSIIALLLSMIMILSLCACGGGSDTGGGTTASTYNETEMLEAMDTPEVIRCSKYLYEHNVPYLGVWDFISALQSAAPDNAFTKEISKQYEDLSLSSKSDFEKDFFEIFPIIIGNGWSCMEPEEQGMLIDTEYFGSAWAIGYDDKEASGELPYNARIIILETTGIKEYPDHKMYAFLTAFDGQYDVNLIYDESELKAITGIDVKAENGKCKNTNTRFSVEPTSGNSKLISDIERALTGVAYTKLDGKDVSSMIEAQNVFNSLYKLFIDNEFFDYDPYDDTFGELDEREADKAAEEAAKEEAAAKARAPEIGMTKEEIENGMWGKPDRKNVNEYSWGTTEQWVYENQGYIYFENGIVDAIQYRD